MGFLGRLVFLIGSVLAIGLALWLSITIFAFLLIGGGIAVLVVAGRQFLVKKGILNPRPGVPPEPQGNVIDGEFEQIENPMAKADKE